MGELFNINLFNAISYRDIMDRVKKDNPNLPDGAALQKGYFLDKSITKEEYEFAKGVLWG